MNIVITGANGFLGTWLCKTATQYFPDAHTHAIIRSSANADSLENIDNLNIHRVIYENKSLCVFFEQFKKNHGTIDLLIHNAGLTKSINAEDFFRINTGITETIIDSVKKTEILDHSGKLAYISSQAALGPVGCGGPVSAYGESKLATETLIKTSGLDHIIFRPTGIYGPYDLEFLSLFKSVKSLIYPCAAPIKQKITLIHAFDVAYNVIDISLKTKNKTIHLDDGHIYSHKEMKTCIEKLLKRRSMLFFIPRFVTRLFLGISEVAGKIFGFEPILTREKHNEITKDWDHDFSLERNEIPLTIKFDLEKGFENTYHFYKEHNLL